MELGRRDEGAKLIRSRTAPAGYIADSELLHHAYELAAWAHGEQRRATDRTLFIEHVVEVGDLLHAAGLDERLVAAGLLHDAVERGDLSERRLRAQMDEDICGLVMALTEDAAVEPFGRRKEALREQVRSAGTRAVTIFAADKLSDIRGLTRGVDRFEDSIEARMGTTIEAMAQHYEDSVSMIEAADPTCPFIPLLRAELDALRTATPIVETRRRSARRWGASSWTPLAD